MEQPGFGVQAGAAGVVADAHLGAVGHKPIEGAAVGGAQVDGGALAQWALEMRWDWWHHLVS